MSKYVVLGAGIIGLYTTYHLVHTLGINPKDIKIIAEFFPGDQSINYTSPWAGGNFSCITSDEEDVLRFDKLTYTNLQSILDKIGEGAGLEKKPSTELFDRYPGDIKIASLKSYLEDYKPITQENLPKGVEYGFTFTTWNFNCPVFLANFLNYLKKLGVQVTRTKIHHISQAFLPNTKAVFNCSGIGARSLPGVQDTNVYPTRGQVVVVQAPHIQESRMRWGDDSATYIIPRPNSNDELVLGGFLQKENWTGDTFLSETQDIIKRTTELFPEILDQPLKILRVAAGLRPSRHGGVRIEVEKNEGKYLIHNYGASGYGYQAGFGMALKAIELFAQEAKLVSKL